MNEINLLRPKKEERRGLKNAQNILRILSLVLLFLTFLSSIILFLLKLNSPLLSTKKEEENILLRLSPLKSKMAQFFIIEERLTNISEIIVKRPNWEKIIETLEKKKPQEVSIDNLSMDKKDLSLSVSSYSLLLLDKFLNNLIEITGDKKVFSNLTLNSTTLDKKSGKYTFSIAANLP